MKIKTQDLTGPALDWAVDEAQGYGSVYLRRWNEGGDRRFTHCQIMRAYCTDWALGGPILEAEQISIVHTGIIFPSSNAQWRASIRHDRLGVKGDAQFGPTPLIAGMRRRVALKLGDEVEIPDELFSGA